MKKIDLEHHFYDVSTIDGLAARKAGGRFPYYDRETDLIHWTDMVSMPQGRLLDSLLELSEARLERMDKWGIDAAVLSCSPGIEYLEPQSAIPLCRAANDAIYAAMRRFPGRFLGSALLPVKDVGAALAELERCVGEYGFCAWHTHSNYPEDEAPDQPKFLPLFKKAAELGVYVYLHPQNTSDPRLSDFGFTVAGPALGFTVNTLVTLTRMLVGGLFDEVPDLKLVCGHLGEGLPFLLDRMENRVVFLKNPALRNKNPLKYYFKKNIWLATSGNMSKEAFRCAMDVVGLDHIVLGTDYPFEDIDQMMGFLEGLPLGEAEFERLYYKNAAEFLGIRV